MNLIIGLIIFVALLAIWFISVGNRLNRYLVTIEESKRTVDIVLVKRYDTISEMLKVAKAYAKHEQQLFRFSCFTPRSNYSRIQPSYYQSK